MNLNLQTPKKQRGFIQAVIGGALAIGSLVSGNKARKAQNSARAAQQQANRVRNFQAKRQFLRDFRQQQAAAIANPLAAGAVDSSFSRATQSSQGTQANIASLDFSRLNELGELASANLNSAARAQFASSVFGTLGQFANSPGGQDLIDRLS